MPKKDIPSKLDRKIIEKRAGGETIREIAEQVGVPPSSVFLAVKRLEPEIVEALRLNGYGLDKAVTNMVEMTLATKTEFFSNKGVITDQVDVEDNGTRLQARREMLRLHAAYPANDTPIPASSVQIALNVVIPAPSGEIQ